MSTLRVLGPRILVRPAQLPDTTESGLAVVHGRRNSIIRGEVIAVGEGPRLTNGAVVAAFDATRSRLLDYGFTPEGADDFIDGLDLEPREHLVHVGDQVLFAPDVGEELHFDRDLLLAMTEDDVIAVIEEGDNRE